MIRYRCGKCGQEMESPESMTDHAEKCPSCGAHVNVPHPRVVKAKPLGLIARIKHLPVWAKVAACAAGVLVYTLALVFIIDHVNFSFGTSS